MDDASTRESVQELFDLYADGIYQYAYYSLGNAADAKDAVQDTFLRVVRAWDSFRGDAQAKTWLWRIAKNCIIDIQRRRRRRLTRETPRAEMTDIGSDGDPSLSIRIELLDLLRDLPLPQREVVTLRYLDDFSTKDAARILGWNEAKVRNTLHAAIRALRKTAFRDLQPKGANQHG